jgi:hypothetical protein
MSTRRGRKRRYSQGDAFEEIQQIAFHWER